MAEDSDIKDWDFAKKIFILEEEREPNTTTMDTTAIAFIQAGIRHQRLKKEKAALRLTQPTFERMSGLSSIRQMNALNNALQSLAADWLKEGFEADDIEAFVMQRLKETIKTNINA